jgi:hypothetical protein
MGLYSLIQRPLTLKATLPALLHGAGKSFTGGRISMQQKNGINWFGDRRNDSLVRIFFFKLTVTKLLVPHSQSLLTFLA